MARCTGGPQVRICGQIRRIPVYPCFVIPENKLTSRGALRWVATLLAVIQATALAAQSRPDEIEGLVAWYTVDSLHRELRDLEPVKVWKDSSENGHNLIDDANGVTAVFHTVHLNGKPLVEVGRLNSYSVSDPFELQDHTIFLVCSVGTPLRALFRSDTDEKAGLILSQDGTRNLYQSGKHQRLTSYNSATDLPAGFHVSVLARESDALRSFVNGRDLSSDSDLDGPVRVGKFFQLQRTQFVGIDGGGLRIAEMVFYDRYLEDVERDAVTRYLAAEYGIELQPEPPEPHTPSVPDPQTVQAWLSTSSAVNLNQQTVALEWDRDVKIDPPFRRTLDAGKSELYCTNRRARVRLFVRLPMATAEPQARVRVLILKNGQEYHSVDRVSEPFQGSTGALTATVQFATTVTMKAGDYVEVVTVRDGADGPVTLVPGQAVWTAEAR